jgi:hypothetical protein
MAKNQTAPTNRGPLESLSDAHHQAQKAASEKRDGKIRQACKMSREADSESKRRRKGREAIHLSIACRCMCMQRHSLRESLLSPYVRWRTVNTR